MMMPNENINEDDFDYFQFFGQKRIETEVTWAEKQKEDVDKFKASRANLIIKEEEKNPGVYIAKETKSNNESTSKTKLPIKISIKPKVIVKHPSHDTDAKKNGKEAESAHKVSGASDNTIKDKKDKIDKVVDKKDKPNDDSDQSYDKEDILGLVNKKLKTK